MRFLVVLLLVAPAAFAQILGDQTGIMGADSGFFDPGIRPPMRIDAQPFTRTVTCTGSRTITGTATGAGAVTWSASPDGASGACTGTTSWSCPVAVSPNAAGEGVETITVSQSGGGSATVDIGFYVSGAHSCFLAQSYDGAYNSGKADLAAVGTWVNLGSSALNVTQATGSAQPTYRTSIVGGQPVVRCDGGDRLGAATAADWTFLNNSADWSADIVFATTSANPDVAQVTISTQNALAASAQVGLTIWHEDRSSISANDRARTAASNGTALMWSIDPANGGLPAAKFNQHGVVHQDDAGAGADVFQYANAVANGTGTVVIAYSAAAPIGALSLCATVLGTSPLTGDVFRSLIYTSALSATQIAINKQTDEWALGGTLPVTP